MSNTLWDSFLSHCIATGGRGVIGARGRGWQRRLGEKAGRETSWVWHPCIQAQSCTGHVFDPSCNLYWKLLDALLPKMRIHKRYTICTNRCQTTASRPKRDEVKMVILWGEQLSQKMIRQTETTKKKKKKKSVWYSVSKMKRQKDYDKTYVSLQVVLKPSH